MELHKRPLPDVKTGSEIAADFTDWLLEKVNTRQQQSGRQQIDAFSHGPVMAAFLLMLEKKLDTEILGRDIFKHPIPFLGYMNFHADSFDKNSIYLHFGAKK